MTGDHHDDRFSLRGSLARFSRQYHDGISSKLELYGVYRGCIAPEAKHSPQIRGKPHAFWDSQSDGEGCGGSLGPQSYESWPTAMNHGPKAMHHGCGAMNHGFGAVNHGFGAGP